MHGSSRLILLDGMSFLPVARPGGLEFEATIDSEFLTVLIDR
jgi:hypothetical protein